MSTVLAAKSRFQILSYGLLSISFLTLAGCASKMSKSDCEKTDFYSLGIKDGEDGKTTERFDQMNQRCRELGAEPNATNYANGRTVGLAKYCTESLGEKDAKKGSTQNVCMEVPPYKRAYTAKLNEMTAETRKNLGQLRESESKLEKKQNDAKSKLDQLEAQKNAVPQK